MAKLQSTFLNMALSLFIISTVCSLTLGVVYLMTKDAIEASRIQARSEALKKVLPGFNNDLLNESYKVTTVRGDFMCYPAKNDGTPVGIAVESFTTKGYSGRIALSVGFLPDGTIYNIAVTDHKETPGLGAKISLEGSKFITQFKGKNPASSILRVKKDGGDIDAITAATISSRAICDAIQAAQEAIQQHNQEHL